MVICCIVGCSNRSGRDKYSYHRLPAVIKHQGSQMLALSTERHRAWLSAISRDDLTEKKLRNVFVCGRHFTEGLHIKLFCLRSLLLAVLYIGEPAYIMDKSNVYWAPCLHLGHDKIKLSVLQSASERAMRTNSRRKKMDEASAQSLNNVSNSDPTNSEAVGDEAENTPNVKEVQTDEVQHESKMVQTNLIEVCNRDVQTESDEFFAEKNFLSEDTKVEYRTTKW